MQCKLDGCLNEAVAPSAYCGKVCKRIGLSRARKGVARNVKPRHGVCLDCGIDFIAPVSGPMPSQCQEHRKREKRCECGSVFVARPGKDRCNDCSTCLTCSSTIGKGKAKYCSKACWPDGYKPKPLATKACTVCGKEFETAGDFTKLRCSRRCKRKHDSASPAAKANAAMRRAKKRDAVAERVVPNVVYERDNWTCQICFEPIDRNVSPRHRLAASLDHVHPLSLGGAHTYANIRLAHIGCNAKKGNRLEVAQISA